MLLQPLWGKKSVWLAGAVTLLVHSYAHFGNLLLDQPLMYLAFGAVLAIVWGLPLTILALRRDLERLRASTGFRTRCVSSAVCSGKWRVSTCPAPQTVQDAHPAGANRGEFMAAD
jgi:hypothetical protein